MGILILFFAWLAKGATVEGHSTKQTIAEGLVDLIDGLVNSNMGKNQICFAPYMLSLISFIAISNISGFIFLGFVRPPTADWATTLALAVLTFCMMEGFGVGTNGLFRYLKSLAEPVVILLPINIISEFAPIVSLSFRLFGNILGGLIIGTLIYSMIYLQGFTLTVWTVVAGIILMILVSTGFFDKIKKLPKHARKSIIIVGALAAIPILAIMFVHFYFDLFSGLMQSYIFTMLTMMFVSSRISEDWHAEN